MGREIRDTLGTNGSGEYATRRRGTMKYRSVALLLISGATIGCADDICLTLPDPVIQVDVRDSITSAPAAYQASLIITGGGVYDSTYVGPRADSLSVTSIRSAPPRRTTAYTVRVRRDGYQLWQRTGVQIEESGCEGARSVTLSVRLQPRP